MKINDKMRYYIELALDELFDEVQAGTKNDSISEKAKDALIKHFQSEDNALLRALELACADLEAHTITPSAEDMDALQAVKHDLDEWNMDEAY